MCSSLAGPLFQPMQPRSQRSPTRCGRNLGTGGSSCPMDLPNFRNRKHRRVKNQFGKVRFVGDRIPGWFVDSIEFPQKNVFLGTCEAKKKMQAIGPAQCTRSTMLKFHLLFLRCAGADWWGSFLRQTWREKNITFWTWEMYGNITWYHWIEGLKIIKKALRRLTLISQTKCNLVVWALKRR